MWQQSWCPWGDDSGELVVSDDSGGNSGASDSDIDSESNGDSVVTDSQ